MLMLRISVFDPCKSPNELFIYFSQTLLQQAFSKPQPVSSLAFPRVSRRIIEASCPEITGVDPALVEEIFSLLPPLSEAIRLCEIYLEVRIRCLNKS